MDYLLLKWLHILSSTILFGTGIGSAFYMFMANRRKDIKAMQFAVRHVVIADWCFTTPAVIIQFVTGLAMVHSVHFSFNLFWLKWGLVLFFFVGICWLPVVWIQIKMRDMLEGIEELKELKESYWLLDKIWIFLGGVAFPATIIIFYLMVYKPL